MSSVFIEKDVQVLVYITDILWARQFCVGTMFFVQTIKHFAAGYQVTKGRSTRVPVVIYCSTFRFPLKFSVLYGIKFVYV